MATAPLTGAKRLKELLSDPSQMVVCPGVFDGLTARLALASGFDALYMVIPGFHSHLPNKKAYEIRQVLERPCRDLVGPT